MVAVEKSFPSGYESMDIQLKNKDESLESLKVKMDHMKKQFEKCLKDKKDCSVSLKESLIQNGRKT
jgi:hypothetical protein